MSDGTQLDVLEVGDEPTEEQPDEFYHVKVIKVQGESALVEWAGPNRAFVPLSEIVDGMVPESILSKCPFYGVPWEQYLDIPDRFFVIKEISEKLREAGIWTLEDLQTKDRVVTRIAANIIGRAVWSAAKRATAKGVEK